MLQPYEPLINHSGLLEEGVVLGMGSMLMGLAVL